MNGAGEFKRIQTNSQTAMAYFSVAGRLIDWSGSFERLIGASANQPLEVGQSVELIHDRLTGKRCTASWQPLVGGGLCCQISPTSNLGLGNPEHAATLLRAIVEEMPHMISVKDAVSREYRFCNRESEAVLGAHAVGRTNFEIFDRLDAERIDEQESQLLERGGVLVSDAALVHTLNGAERRMSTKKFVVVDPDGSKYLVTISEDVSQSYAQAIALSDAVETANAANAAKSQFLATMSHEIRTPLNGVLGMVQAMAAGPLDPPQAERLDVIRRSGEALLIILNDILDLSKIEAGKLELEDLDFDLRDLADTVHDAFVDIAAAKGVSLSLVMDEAEGVYRGDPTRLRQILYNLTSNALKFTSSGTVKLEALRRQDGLTLQVTDTGIGMDRAALARLFQQYAQAESSTTRRFGGTGLGLAICRQLAELMGGEISVESRPSSGTTFTVNLPIKRMSSSSSTAAARQTAAPAADLSTIKVLAADDNQTNRLVLAALLNQAGVEPVTVENGAEAVEAWKTGQFDIILMDVQMPIMDGLAATGAIRNEEANQGLDRIPIIALTANAMSHQIEQYREAGMDGFVSKPISIQALFSAIDDALSAAAGP